MPGSKKLSKIVSTKLTEEDYEVCLKMARDYYIEGRIKSPSVSAITRFALSIAFQRYRLGIKPPGDARHPRLPRFK
ncbi:MAG TPA: hypothetical protein VE130_14005 [Nitrososphaeraceae archaeon]|nr:hypothetical protein [Nitrososphaeraceae archaeon]